MLVGDDGLNQPSVDQSAQPFRRHFNIVAHEHFLQPIEGVVSSVSPLACAL